MGIIFNQDYGGSLLGGSADFAAKQPGDWWSSNLPQMNTFSGGTPQGAADTASQLATQTTQAQLLGQPMPLNGQRGGGVSIDQIKALVGNDYSTEHLKQILPQLQAMGVEVQNQARGDLRPRFLLPGGEQWDFGPGGWINSGHGIQPGFGADAPGGGSGTGGGFGGGGLLGGGGNMQGYLSSIPGYQFALQQGLQAVDRGAAAKGTLHTGGTIKAEEQYATGLADQTYGNQYDRALQLAKLGYPQMPS